MCHCGLWHIGKAVLDAAPHTFRYTLISVPRPSGSPSVSSEMAKLPSAPDSQMYLRERRVQ